MVYYLGYGNYVAGGWGLNGCCGGWGYGYGAYPYWGGYWNNGCCGWNRGWW